MIKYSNKNAQQGFTLVELAIVLMIIGLLIGGILRGQELIENARITTTIQQTKAYDGAVTTFRDSYNAWPGDIASPSTRLPNCSATPCSTAGDGNAVVGAALVTLAGTYVITGENANFWTHQAAANLISGVSSTPSAAVWGDTFPAAKVSGGFHMTNVAIPAASPIPAVSGNFLVLRNAAGSGATETTGAANLSPGRAAQIDRKLDDGLPRTGDVIGQGTASCTGTAYTESSTVKDCNLLIRIQS